MSESPPRPQRATSVIPVLGWALPLLAFAVLGGAYLVFAHFSGILDERTSENLKIIAVSRKLALESFLFERKADASMLTRRESVKNVLTGRPEREALRQAYNTVQLTAANYNYSDVRIVDTALNTVASFRSDTSSKGEKAAFARAIETRQTTLVDFHVSDRGKTSFGVAAPVLRGDGGEPIGAVYVEVDTNSALSHIIAGWSGSSATAEVLFFETTPDEIIYLTMPRFMSERKAGDFHRLPRSPRLAASQVATGGTLTTFEGTDYRNERVLAAGAPIEGTPWYVIVKIDQAEAESPVHQVALAITLITLMLLGGIGWLARMSWRAKAAEFALAHADLDAQHLAARRAALDAYILVDNAGRMLEVNEATARLSGYSVDELTRMKIPDVEAHMGEADVAAANEKLRREGSGRFTSQWRRRDGSLVDVEVSIVHVASSGGDTFHAFVKDITGELASRRRIETLNRLYRFLSSANAMIFSRRTVAEILEAVCTTAVNEGGFVLVWAGLPDAAGAIKPATVSGAARDYLKDLVITTDPASPMSRGPTGRCMIEQRAVYVNDFLNDPTTAVWHAVARRHHIGASAAVPVIVNGSAVAALTFHSSTPGFFDREFCDLVEEVTRNVALAWSALDANRARDAAESQRDESERRFARIFDASPVPIQIHSLSTRRIVGVNRAHVRTFGYAPSEIRDEKAWFDRAYRHDPAFRTLMLERWEQELERARAGGLERAIASEEFTVSCRNGEVRPFRAFLSVVGDEIIVPWLDLTEIKKAQTEIVDNERHFRALLDQSVTGIYVTQSNRIVYANPRMCQIFGYTPEEMVDRDSLSLFSSIVGNEQAIRTARVSLADGADSVSLTLNAKRRDGTPFVIGTHAVPGQWNGAPAIIVMGQDITESRHAEQKLAAYVKQLEHAMEGTLQTVAHIVDLRDPHTAGHERCVGLVAADIAREMGWPEERCKNLQLIGLVHDIGKMAVPAELLAKPARLTPLEFDRVKAHAEKGYEILKGVQFPLPIAEIIREHHERLDGSGYPQGLKGAQIMPEARVLAVADVLESMSSHRPYRAALGLDAAVREIESHRGAWFDEEVVAAMLRLIREKKYELPR